ncbi:BTB/POZ domain-containing protein 9-like [Lineus longissimus]|uniref:BTB/POZ domain-containing protein 9-like n=1 Tax=Lineus longissimus TaxID=88925 RepID=UPI002B4EF96C
MADGDPQQVDGSVGMQLEDEHEVEEEHEEPPPVINHANGLSNSYKMLFESNEFSDINLVVGGHKFFAHRLVLMTRSEYFRAMFGGNFRESNPQNNEVVLHTCLPDDAAAMAFKHLLGYIYCGKFDMTVVEAETIQSILLLADLYGFVELRQELENHITDAITNDNVFPVYEFSKANGLQSMCQHCLKYVDTHFCEIINNFPRTPRIVEQFESLPEEILNEIIGSKTLEVPEIRLIAAINSWVNVDLEKRKDTKVRNNLRLHLVSDEHLLNNCRKLGVNSDMIVEAMRIRVEAKNAIDQAIRLFKVKNRGAGDILHTGWCKPFYRGFVVPDVNLADVKLEAEPFKQEHLPLLHGCPDPPGYVCVPIPGNGVQGRGGIAVCLVRAAIINTIRIKLYDDDGRFFSYRVEAYDFERRGYVNLVSYISETCRSWQTLHFTPVFTGIINVHGSRASVGTELRLSKFECYFMHANPPPSKMKLNFIVPTENVAIVEKGAWVISGKNMDKLLSPEYEGYNGPEYCTTAKIDHSIKIQLSQPYMVDSMSFLLLDTLNRTYAYKVEVSKNLKDWELVADTGDRMMKSLQVIRFREQPVTFIRITGTRSSLDGYLHIVHFECPASKAELSRDGPAEIWNDFFL